MSADIEKYVRQRRSVERACLEQPWQTFDELTNSTFIASNEATENRNFLSQTMWKKEEQSSFKVNTLILNAVSGYESMTENYEVSQKSDNSDGTNIENQTDALLDQLLESTVQQTKKQLRFAQTETDLMTLSLPCHLVTSDFSNPVEEFLGTLVEDIKDKVKDSFQTVEDKNVKQNMPLNKVQKNEDFETKKLLVEQLLTNNNSSHREETAMHQRSVPKKHKQRKPKTIAELLEIIDSEIPIQFSKKPTIPIKPNFPRDSVKIINISQKQRESCGVISTVEREVVPSGNATEHSDLKQEASTEGEQTTETAQHMYEECKNLNSATQQDQASE